MKVTRVKVEDTDRGGWDIRRTDEVRLLWLYGNTLVTVVDDVGPLGDDLAKLKPLQRALLVATLEHALAEFKKEKT